MSALRNQLGSAEDEADEGQDELPELDDDQFPVDSAYRSQAGAVDQDSGAYSFGSYPAQPGQASQSRAEGIAPELPDVPTVDGAVSVVARETIWKGEISSENSIHVHGNVEGSLSAREDIWIAEGAEVDATVSAQRVVVAGVLRGQISASTRFVAADVTSPIFVIHEGANINGNFKVGSGGDSDTRSDRASAASVIQRRTRSTS
jgi:cytoskeletal protein CcmA (bactofilin family)